MAGVKPDLSSVFPVLPFSLRGRRMVSLLQSFYRVLGLFLGKKWQVPLTGFEENPRESPYAGATYLGYKYYHRPPLLGEPGIQAYFRGQELKFPSPTGFIAQHRLTMSIGGDLMPYERLRPDTTQHLWDEVGAFFFSTDVVVGNLETPIVSDLPPGTVPEIMLNDMHFNGSETLFRIFNGADRFRGFDVLSTANNHSLDQGERGITETLDFLEKRGILATGTARNLHGRGQIPVLERNGIRVAFVAWTYSLNKFLPPADKPWLVNYDRLNVPDASVERVVADLRLAREQGADVVALLLHTGNAYQAFPSAHTVKIYHRIFEQSGVDLILGSHPHNPQPMERYLFRDPFTGRQKQGFAIYSLGDFVAYDIFVWGRLVPLLRLTLEKGTLNGERHTQLTEVQVLPVYHWGDKAGKDVRFLDLKKTLSLVDNERRPPYLSDLCVRELRHLNWFCDQYFLPENAAYLLASTDS